MWFHSKGHIFYKSLCFLPHCSVNISREVRLMLPNTYQENMTPTHALIFQKYVKMCVCIRHIKKMVEIDYTLGGGSYSKKRLAGMSFFQKMGSQGPGHVSPGGV